MSVNKKRLHATLSYNGAAVFLNLIKYNRLVPVHDDPILHMP
jgi:hypothetical protein